ncbi:MAG: UDP-2,4-diacetamido-2,4,6-trideoxy-beta-L-altropyranose hydrolase, partial [Chitinophagaceae bacterium]
MTDSIKSTIFFRADGDSEMGLGHIIRSSAIASYVKDHYKCILLTRCKIHSVLHEARSIFSEIVSLPVIDYYLEAENFSSITLKNCLFVLDGYFFDTAYQKILKSHGREFFFIDDIHAFKYYARVIVNQSGKIGPIDYEALPGTQYYLGPLYALLRAPFLEAAKEREKKLDNKNCFICFGGADPENKTLEILKNKNIQSGFEHFHVVIGSAYKYISELEDFATENKKISIHTSLSAEEMEAVMQQCCFAICSPSSVVYEYMSIGGVVFLEQTADNQKDILSYLVEERLAFHLKDVNEIGHSDILQSIEKQAIYFDGQSGERVLKIFNQYFAAKNLTIRKATINDLYTCFNWANDSDVRQQSFNENSIALEGHTAWFNNKLTDANTHFFILELNQQPVAQIRFDVKNNEAVIGYLADKSIRNKGLGTT